MKKLNKLKLLSSILFSAFISGCANNTIKTPPNQRQTPDTNQSPKPITKRILPKSLENDLSAPQQKPSQNSSLGLFVANDKFLPGALVLNFDSFKGVSPAEESGLKRGDIIIMIGSCEVTDKATYFSCLNLFKPKDIVSINFNRDGLIYKTQSKLAERY